MNNQENLPNNPNINVIHANKTGLFTNYIFKAIPLAFDESMSYYETLCGLLNYLKNTIIPTVNNNADAVAELQNLYIELKQYVDNYFNSLDIQEEINNKLDEMIESGQLQSLIEGNIGGSVNASAIGFLTGEENATYNFNLLKTIVTRNIYPIINFDNEYYFNNTETLNLNNKLHLNGRNNNSKIIFKNAIDLLTLDDGIIINNLNIESLVDGFYLINTTNQYTQKLDSIIINNCYFNKACISRATLQEEYTINMLNYGFNKIIITNSTFENQKNISLIIQNTPCELYINNIKVHNTMARFCVFGTTNDNNNGDAYRKQMNIKVENSSYINDDDFYITNESQYYCFIWTKCGNAIINNNYVENICLNQELFSQNNEPIETFGMYLLSTNLMFTNNTFKNIYNFSYNITSNKAEVCSILPNIKGYTGEKIIDNNSFILEKSWLTSKCSHYNLNIQNLNAPLIWAIFNNNSTYKITNNIIDTYFGYFSTKNYYYDYKDILIKNNNFIINNLDRQNSYIFQALSGNFDISNNNFNITNMKYLLNIIFCNDSEEHTIEYINITNNDFNIKNGKGTPTLLRTNDTTAVTNLNINNNIITILNQINYSNTYFFVEINNYNNASITNNLINGDAFVPILTAKIGKGLLYYKNNKIISKSLTGMVLNNRLDLLVDYQELCDTIKYIIKINKKGTEVDFSGETYIKTSNNLTNNLIDTLNSSGENVQLTINDSLTTRIYDTNRNTIMRGGLTSYNKFTIYIANDYVNANENITDFEIEITSLK